MGCYNSLVTTHRVHDISPILPHVVADTTHIMHLAKADLPDICMRCYRCYVCIAVAYIMCV